MLRKIRYSRCLAFAMLALVVTMIQSPRAHTGQSSTGTADVRIDRESYLDNAAAFQALQDAVDNRK
jgi:hypothetical protein